MEAGCALGADLGRRLSVLARLVVPHAPGGD
jgi:hypothetical protein